MTEWPNLLLAYRKAAKGKRAKGSAACFEHQLADRLLLLQAELKDSSYKPGEYVHFTIHDPKQRRISAAPFRDRVVHHALCNIIEPLFERQFVFDSYANRKGKGTHRAIDRVQEYARQHRVSLDGLWVRLDDHGAIAFSVLAVPNQGRTAMVFASRPRSRHEVAPIGELLDHACGELDRTKPAAGRS